MTSKQLCITALLLSFVAGASSFAEQGEGTFAIGYAKPDGDFDRYAGTALLLSVRGNVHLADGSPFGLWMGFQFMNFKYETQEVPYEHAGFDDTGTLTTKEQAYALMLGGQFGSASTKAFFRPRIAGGLGMYLFVADRSLKVETISGEDEEVDSKVDDMRIRFGTHISIGADFFFTPKWGLGLEIFYDYVWNLRQALGDTNEKVTGRYGGVALCVVMPGT